MLVNFINSILNSVGIEGFASILYQSIAQPGMRLLGSDTTAITIKLGQAIKKARV